MRKQPSAPAIILAALLPLLMVAGVLFLAKALAAPDSPQTMSMTDQDRLRMGIAKCWFIPETETPDKRITVKIAVLMNPDASIKALGVIDAEKERYEHDAAYHAAADRALAALKQCSPFTFLPMNKYQAWKELELTFDPMQMK